MQVRPPLPGVVLAVQAVRSPAGAFLSARTTARGTTREMSGATPTFVLANGPLPHRADGPPRPLRDRTSPQTGDGRDPTGWKDSFDSPSQSANAGGRRRTDGRPPDPAASRVIVRLRARPRPPANR